MLANEVGSTYNLDVVENCKLDQSNDPVVLLLITMKEYETSHTTLPSVDTNSP